MDVCQVHTSAHIHLNTCTRRRRLTRGRLHTRVASSAAQQDVVSVPTSEYQTLAQLLRASAASSPDALRAAVAERRQQLTTPFLAWLSDQASGSGPEAAELDVLGAKLAALCDTLDGSEFAEQLSAAAQGQLQALGSLSAHGADVTSLVGDVEAEHLQQRWAALAVWGVENAPGQAAVNADSRRTSASQLLGRVPLSATQTATVTAPLPEDRILAVLLSIPDAADRVAAVDDALTPPGEASMVDEAQQAHGDTPLGDEMLFTTPPRLLAAIDRALVGALMRDSEDGRRAGQLQLVGATGTVAALQQLRDAVLQRLAVV